MKLHHEFGGPVSLSSLRHSDPQGTIENQVETQVGEGTNCTPQFGPQTGATMCYFTALLKKSLSLPLRPHSFFLFIFHGTLQAEEAEEAGKSDVCKLVCPQVGFLSLFVSWSMCRRWSALCERSLLLLLSLSSRS